jgi:hypothetical protein
MPKNTTPKGSVTQLQAQSQSTQNESRKFQVGTRVELNGLQKATHLNGRSAHVIGYDSEVDRLQVELELSNKGEDHSVRAKEANLLELPAMPRTAAALQELVDLATDDCRVSIPAGKFLASDGCSELVIKSAITLTGQGKTQSTLHFPVSVSPDAAGTLLRLARFGVVNARVKVCGKKIKSARLHELSIKQRSQQEDALILDSIGPSNSDPDSMLVENCDVQGGSDGVMIDTYVRLLNCSITGAAARGIFANSDFVIENCTVQGCGSYGMKTRAGCERRGRNSIQAGPWDQHMQLHSPGFGFEHQGGYDSYDDDDDDDDGEMGSYGFTHEQEMELLSQGVKPWDDDAHEVLEYLGY